MSKVVDSRVVEMRFDNKQFEAGVNSTMSTLDKLKHSLKLTEASKGLENLSSASKNVDMSSLSKSVETVQARFSALQVIGVTALANITNSAINAGKNLISSLTISPIMDGYREYTTQLGSIQTILANTASKGSTLGEVNAALKELNEYADQTIYNFSEMTRNIGTFTAAGVDLDTAVTSIKGIANLAAASGSSAQQASVAMYQLSQAIAAGKVQLMDWNSVVNAGMGGELFQNALKRTAEHFGTNVDAMIKKYGSFRESLTKGEWLTTEVLTETLTQLSGAYSKADLIAQGYTEKQADDIVKLADMAKSAATEVKTFGQLIDTTREAVGSGWSDTWAIIFGDLEEAKDLFTGISNVVSGFVDKMSDARNDFLNKGLSTGWKQFIREGISDEEGFIDTVKQVAKEQGVAVDDMINKNGSFAKSLKEGWMTTDILSQSLDKFVDRIGNMSDEQLKEAGYTKQQVEELKNLKKSVDDGTISLNDYVKKMKELSGRENFIEGFKNIFDGIMSVVNPIKDAIGEIFDPLSGDVLYNASKAFREFTSNLKIAEETADKIKRTFKGLFSIIKLIGTIVGGVFSTAFEIVTTLLGEFFNLTGHGVDGILSLTAAIGDAITDFQEWITSLEIFGKVADGVVGIVKGLIRGVKSFVKAFTELPQIQMIVDGVKGAFKGLSDFASDLFDGVEKGTIGAVDAISIFAGRLGDTAKHIFDSIVENVTSVIDTIKNGCSEAGSTFADIVKTIGDTISKIDFRPLAAIIASLGMFFVVKKLANAFNALTAPLDAVAGTVDKFGGVLDSLKKRISAKNMSTRATAIKDIAKAIAILVGSIALLTQLDTGKVWGGIAVIGALIGMIGALTFVSGKYGPKEAFEFGKLSLALLGVSSALLILSFALKNINSLDPDKATDTFIALGAMVAALSAVIVAFGKCVKGKSAMNVSKVGSMLFKLSIALGIMTFVMKMISEMKPGDISKGMVVIAAFSGIMVGLTAMTKLAGKEVGKVGSTLLKISGAMAMMVLVVKMISGLKPDEIIKGTLVIGLFGGILAGLTAMTRLAGKGVTKLGGTLFGISSAIAMLVLVTKMISGLEPSEIVKGSIAIAALGSVIVGLVALTRFVGKDVVKMSMTILSLSAAIGVLAGVSIILSLIDLDGLKKGVTAVSILSAMMALMIYATKGAQNCKGNLIVMSVAIGLLAASAATLSLIDESKLRNASVGISMMMATFALIIKSTEYAKKSLSTLIIVTAVVGALAGILAMMSALDVDSAIQNASGLAILLTSISASMFILSKSGDVSPKALASMGIMTLIVGGLAGILGVLSSFNVGSTLEIAASLSLLLLSLSGSLVILNAANTVAPNALVAMGIMTLITGGLAAIIGMLASMDVGSTIEIAESLSKLVLSLSASCVVLAGVGLLGSAAFVGIGALATLVASMGGLMLAIGGLVSYIPDAKRFLDEGIGVLNKIASGIGQFAGNIVGGFLEGAASNLPEVGKQLTAFMDSIKPFIEGAKSIDEKSMTGVKMLAQTIAILTSANLVESITSFVTGGSSIGTFAEQLVPFGKAIKDYSTAVSGIDVNAITGSATAAKRLVEVANAIPTEGGLWGIIAGEKNLGQFGDTLVPFGKSMKKYAEAVAGLDSASIAASVTAAKGLVDVASAIPTEGGLWSIIAGEKNLGQFGDTLVPFGQAMKQYALSVVGIDTAAIVASVSAAKGIIDVANSIPPEGGLWSILAGEQNLALFGMKLVPFGWAMKQYAMSVAGIDAASITASVSAAKAMVKVVEAIPGEGVFERLGNLISGGNDPSAIIRTLIPFGNAMKRYSAIVVGVDSAAITTSVSSAKAMIKVAKTITETELSGNGTMLMLMVPKLILFGTAMKQYAYTVAGIDAGSISSSVSAAKQIVSLINSTANINTKGVGSFVNAINTLGKASVDNFVKAFSGASGKLLSSGKNMMSGLANGIRSGMSAVNSSVQQVILTVARTISISFPSFKNGGSTLASNVAEGIRSGVGRVNSAVTSLVSGASSRLRGYYSSFYSAGTYVASGFANGIRSRINSAASAAAAMASAASAAARKNLGIKSPSRVFKKIGSYVPQGFAIGITKFSGAVEKATRSMTGRAVDGASFAMSRVNDILSGDMDVQPTIRPVMDLSNVESGAAAIDGMFRNQQSVSVMSNVGAISNMMRYRNQNGDSDEIVNAIDKLRRDLGKLERPSYNVNGVTYDDGSNVSNTVDQLIRAIRLERRV